MSQQDARTTRALETLPVAMVRSPPPRLLRVWIVPVLAMAVLAFLVFLAFYALDVFFGWLGAW